ncbi:hypothetical protein ACFQ15_02185 [Sphingomonas hankookensis]|nr:hypothetical protein [Sphingomonas hankookensis]
MPQDRYVRERGDPAVPPCGRSALGHTGCTDVTGAMRGSLNGWMR